MSIAAMSLAPWCVVSLLGAAGALAGVSGPVWYQPEQVHLAYGEQPSEMVVTWVTPDQVNSTSYVEFGPMGNMTDASPAKSWQFISVDKQGNRSMWIHRAVMQGLKPADRYAYHVGSALGFSDLFEFQAKHTDATWAPRLAVYGDLGNENAQSVTYLQKAAQLGHLDAILHIGDFAYDMDNNAGQIGDAFMRQIEPIAAYIPYMTLPGNHEKLYNFTQYRNRFSMPGKFDSLMYSMTLGPARIIMFNTEVFYKNENPDGSVMLTQYNWLEQELTEANRASNRAETPWLIVMGHRPMYCSNSDGLYEHCNNPQNPVRVGLDNITRAYSLEDLFYKHGVDLHMYAHEHSYERLYPLYRGVMCNGSAGPYINPTGPVHIITGSAGDREGQTKFDKIPYPYSAFRTDDYGYTRLHLLNNSHLSLEEVSTDRGGAVIDSMMLIKEKHGPGLYTCHQSN